jgi:hypothetical protein
MLPLIEMACVQDQKRKRHDDQFHSTSQAKERRETGAETSSNHRSKRKCHDEGTEHDELNITDRAKRLLEYRPPERAKRSAAIQLHNKTSQTDWPPRLSDLTIPRTEYLYSKLSRGDIRLLAIQPGSRNGDIKCRLETVSENMSVAYEAVSYTWGSDPAIFPILLDDHTFFIRSNLDSLLRHLRHSTQEVYLWIDALCINQLDDEERADQVSIMHRIYANAAYVLVWLGQLDAISHHAMDFVSQVLDPEFLQGNWLDDCRILDVVKLLSRPWFSRRWVIQEVALSKKATMICGSRGLTFSDFADAVEVIRSRLAEVRIPYQQSPYYPAYEGLLDQLETSSSIRLLYTVKDLFLRTGSGTIIDRTTKLETLVSDLREFATTDRRDVIYALLGMATETTQEDGMESLKPDYTKSVLEVYSDFVMYCVRTLGSLDIILRAWAPVKRASWHETLIDPDLRFAVPSWISVLESLPFGDPKLKLKSRMNADALVGGPSHRTYNASGRLVANIRFGLDDVTKSYDGSLFVNGLVLGDIEQVSTRMASGIVLKECLEMIGGIDRGAEGQVLDISDPLWRTLCVNRNEDGQRVSPLYRIFLLQILRQYSTLISIDTEDLLGSDQPKHVQGTLKRVQSVVWNRRIFRSPGRHELNGGLIGSVPRISKAGDYIVILYGCSVPVVLRRHPQASGKVL